MASLVLDELNYPNPLLPINHNSQDNKNLISFITIIKAYSKNWYILKSLSFDYNTNIKFEC